MICPRSHHLSWGLGGELDSHLGIDWHIALQTLNGSRWWPEIDHSRSIYTMEIGRHSRAEVPPIRSWLLAFGSTALGRLILPQSLSFWAASWG